MSALRIDRKIAVRDVGRGEQSGFARVPEFIERLNGLSPSLNVLPMRMTNRHGLLGDKASGFHDSVDGDAFTSGYVDIDDLLAGDDLGFQMLLVHFLTERAATSNYARRIGGNFSEAEFNRGHSLGIEAEAEILRAFSATRASASSRTRRASPSAASSATAAATGFAGGSASVAAKRRGSTPPAWTS